MTVEEGQAGRRKTAGLSRQQVLDAAMAILVSEGVDRLTVRRLSEQLDVAVTAVYWHVGKKQALLDALVDRVIAELGEVEARGRLPEDRLRSVGTGLRRTLLERPDLVAFVHSQGRVAGLFHQARRVLARELAAAGLHGRPAALGVEAILLLVVGSVLVDRQVERQPAQSVSAEDLWTESDLPGDPEMLAHLTRPMDEHAVFSYSLDALVRSITAAGS